MPQVVRESHTRMVTEHVQKLLHPSMRFIGAVNHNKGRPRVGQGIPPRSQEDWYMILEEKALLLCLSYLFDLGWLKTIYLWWLLLSPRLPWPWCPDTGRNIIFSILMRLILKQLWFRKADYVPWWDRGLTQSGEGLFRRNTDFSQVRWNSSVWWAFNFKRFCLAFQSSGIWIYIPYNPGNQFLKIYHVNVCTHCLR